MLLTKKDLQSIKEIIQEVVQVEIRHSALRMKEFVRSEFRIQNIVLDARFRAIDARFENLERKIDKRETQLQDHEQRIAALE